jgi:hypothetical protein
MGVDDKTLKIISVATPLISSAFPLTPSRGARQIYEKDIL